MPDEPSSQPLAVPGDDASVIRVLRTQIIRSEVRLLELNDAIAQRDTEGAATRELLHEAQRQLDLSLSEVRSLAQQRDDLAAEIPHIRHQQHLAGIELEKTHGLLRDAIREKDEWVGRHHAAATQLTAEQQVHAAEQQAHAAERGAHAHTRTELDLARRRIAELEQESAARAADVVAHAARIRELDAAIAHLQAVRTELETLRDRLIAQGDTLRSELARTRDTLAEREAKIRQIQDSFSWKITAPLRWLRRTLLRR